jgi:hypothetical protein
MVDVNDCFLDVILLEFETTPRHDRYPLLTVEGHWQGNHVTFPIHLQVLIVSFDPLDLTMTFALLFSFLLPIVGEAMSFSLRVFGLGALSI